MSSSRSVGPELGLVRAHTFVHTNTDSTSTVKDIVLTRPAPVLKADTEPIRSGEKGALALIDESINAHL